MTEKMGMIFITHDLALVADMADRAMVMMRGRVVETGLVKNFIYKSPARIYPGTPDVPACPAFKGERLPVVADFLNPEVGKSRF